MLFIKVKERRLLRAVCNKFERSERNMTKSRLVNGYGIHREYRLRNICFSAYCVHFKHK